LVALGGVIGGCSSAPCNGKADPSSGFGAGGWLTGGACTGAGAACGMNATGIAADCGPEPLVVVGENPERVPGAGCGAGEGTAGVGYVMGTPGTGAGPIGAVGSNNAADPLGVRSPKPRPRAIPGA